MASRRESSLPQPPLVAAAGGDEHLTRALGAMANGLVDLELYARFPPGADLDATWALRPERLPTPNVTPSRRGRERETGRSNSEPLHRTQIWRAHPRRSCGLRAG
jgi:hypothetical protein